MPERRQLLVAATASVLLRPSPAAAAEPAATVALMQGTAVLIRMGMATPLVMGAAVYEGDSIRTAADGRVRLVARDGLEVVIGPGTEVQVNHYRARQGWLALDLMLGLAAGIMRLVAPTQAEPRRIEVLTRSALASVRSTEWIVDETARGTGVFSREGRVVVSGLAGLEQVVLTAGEGTDVPPGGAPSPPRRWGAARRDDVLARTQL